jgi:hypothetical protein
MQMLLESSIFCTQQVTDRTCWWRGNAVGLHQLVVTMEDLAGPQGGAAKRAGRISTLSR